MASAFSAPALYPYYEPPINVRDMMHTPDGEFWEPKNTVIHPPTPAPASDDEDDEDGNANEEQEESPSKPRSFRAAPDIEAAANAMKRMSPNVQMFEEPSKAPVSQALVPTAPPESAAPKVNYRTSRYFEKDPTKKREWRPTEQPLVTMAGLPTFAVLMKENERLKKELQEAERDDKLLEDALLRRRIQRRFQDIDVNAIGQDVLMALVERLDGEKNLASGEYSDWRNFEGISEKKYLKNLMGQVTEGDRGRSGSHSHKKKKHRHRRSSASSEHDEEYD
mmetsp:Transcript_140195/g.244179  ORF Transcript_140195/g.244179 Transcript_140195/m.244179 type:complete len:279 (-) Transcript_140195:1482-2318(-)